MYDYIIIGSGYGGISSAALLAKQGFSVLILESHIAIGGCASFFKRKGFTFDVGATTLSGVLDNQPLGKFFKEINVKPNLKKLDPGMIVYLGDKNKKITRYSDKDKWIKEANNKFGGNQEKFWNKIYSLESRSWQLIANNYRLPPKNINDLIHLASLSNLKYLDLIPGLLRPLNTLLKKYDLNNNNEFVNFIDEQLLISTQNTSKLAPYLTSSIGLAYPSETYYPYGGIYKPLELALNYFKSKNNEIKFKERVTSINQVQDFYEVKTQNNNVYQAKGIISNIPIWNMEKITNGNIKDYFSSISKSFNSAWGAFTLYFAIENTVNIETSYYQVHTRKNLPYASSKSFFVSFSLDDDYEKAPKGWRTVTISTHTNVQEWENISEKEYNEKKEALESAILEEFNYFFSELNTKEKLYIDSGTPNTFKFFTGRHKGYVGGIPHSIKKSILSLAPNTTPFNNFYLVGDTVFPGQGTPAVVLGSLNVIQRIKDEQIKPLNTKSLIIR
jgi:C-3',4' desaturase CrtD